MFGPAMMFQKGSEGFNNKSNKPDGFCGREATFNEVQELCKSRGGRPGLSVLTSLLVSVDGKLY